MRIQLYDCLPPKLRPASCFNHYSVTCIEHPLGTKSPGTVMGVRNTETEEMVPGPEELQRQNVSTTPLRLYSTVLPNSAPKLTYL